ncbi:hypothetical protein [Nonomuraea gerenzanensis]|uniref:Uncharacterized protein n=1 Tax=Nonomuraea gerenzanensis TaxID=93944 RepID=A0A1M4EBT6_9ACTN|nr:hypothetical protein [Nonomuraea gerenzanensis]UBU18372.1 hypothetical protein LCN96_26125 [Nonomuraea gerenzanensis]SBO96202.1 hypothetical protein BN4615_P5718 [Nonomuraea gerenzanensis]
MSTPSPMDHRDLLRRHVGGLERRISQARAAKELIEHALACPDSFAECRHARDRIAARIPPAPQGHGTGRSRSSAHAVARSSAPDSDATSSGPPAS